MVEVLTKPPPLGGGLEILARGADDPDIDRLADGSAERSHALLFDDLEQLRLERLGQQADLVQEDGAPVRDGEQAGLRAPRIGERAALVTKHLRFHERVRNRGAVDVHEWATRPGSLVMKCTCDQALPRSCLSEQQQRRQSAGGRIAPHELLELAAEVDERRARTE